MFSGNFFWIRSEYAATLPALTPETIGGNRFYSEIWLYQKPHTTFSAFETVADLYYVRIPRSLYTLPHPPFADRLMFWWWYNWRKLLKHAFGYSYKYRNQARYQKLRAKQ